MTPFFVSVKLTVQKLEPFYGNGTLNIKIELCLCSGHEEGGKEGSAYMYVQATKKVRRGVCLCSGHEEGGKWGG